MGINDRTGIGMNSDSIQRAYYQQQPTTLPTTNWTITYGTPTLEQIRTVVQEEIEKALHPSQQGESATVEYTWNGKTWRGKVYLVEDEEEKPCQDDEE